jgi:hypothetical protein
VIEEITLKLRPAALTKDFEPKEKLCNLCPTTFLLNCKSKDLYSVSLTVVQ